MSVPIEQPLGRSIRLDPTKGGLDEFLVFGEAVALWADPDPSAIGRTLLFVGCIRPFTPDSSDPNRPWRDGLVYVFERPAPEAQWKHFTTITATHTGTPPSPGGSCTIPLGPPSANQNNDFGCALAIRDNTLAIGGPTERNGWPGVQSVSNAAIVSLYDITSLVAGPVHQYPFQEFKMPAAHKGFNHRTGVNTRIALGEDTVAFCNAQGHLVVWTRQNPAAPTHTFTKSHGPEPFKSAATYCANDVAVVRPGGQDLVVFTIGAQATNSEQGVWWVDPAAPSNAPTALKAPSYQGVFGTYGWGIAAGRYSHELFVGGAGQDATVFRYRWNGNDFVSSDWIKDDAHMGYTIALYETQESGALLQRLAVNGSKGPSISQFVNYHSNENGNPQADFFRSRTRITSFGRKTYVNPPPTQTGDGQVRFGWSLAVLPNLIAVGQAARPNQHAPGGAVFVIDIPDYEHPGVN